MAQVVGTHADVKLINTLVEEVNDTGLIPWVRVSLITDVSGNAVNYWIPDDSARAQFTPSLPTGWPPVVGDVWRVGTSPAIAWIIQGTQGVLLFVTAQNINTGSQAMTADAALGRFGTQLNLVSRV